MIDGSFVAQLRRSTKALMSRVESFLSQLVATPSLPGEESAAIDLCGEAFRDIGCSVDLVPLGSRLSEHEDYNSVVPGISPRGRYNLRIGPQSEPADTPCTALNAHIDVVPPSSGMDRPWEPVVEGTRLFGRGACDDKGGIATLYLLMLLWNEYPEPATRRPELHIVVEEENGGNGTLSLLLGGVDATEAIVLEPTDLKVCPVSRGAVWFAVECLGTATHSSRASAAGNPLVASCRIMEAIAARHDELLKRADRNPLFARYENPAPLTFGRLHAGVWPSSVPERAIIEGVFAFLPPHSREDVQVAIREAVLHAAPHTPSEVRFPYRHGSAVTPVGAPLVVGLSQAATSLRSDPGSLVGDIEGFPASCDAWYYHHIGRIPNVVFGPGSLSHAHSRDEQIDLIDVETAAVALRLYLA